jgi:hypothetical protein
VTTRTSFSGTALIRPFIMTGGRTATSRPELRWESLVEAIAPAPDELSSEAVAIVSHAVSPVSVAELSAVMQLPTAVVAILVEDLVALNVVQVHHTDPVEIELSELTRMIERVRGL